MPLAWPLSSIAGVVVPIVLGTSLNAVGSTFASLKASFAAALPGALLAAAFVPTALVVALAAFWSAFASLVALATLLVRRVLGTSGAPAALLVADAAGVVRNPHGVYVSTR